MENYRNKAIIIGSNHYNTLGVIRSLGEMDVDVYLVLVSSNKKNYVTKSKYIKKYWQINKNEKEIVDILLEKFSNEKKKPVIISVSDYISEIIDKNFELLKKIFICPNAGKAGQILKLMNKATMANLAFECGLNIPKSLISKVEDLKISSKNIGCPFIIKPLQSIDGDKKDISICKKEEDIESFIKKFKKLGYRNVLIQKFITNELEIGIAGCRFNNTEEIIIPGIMKKIRNYPKNFGSCSFGKLDIDIEKFIDMESLKKFIKKTGYHGIFDIDFIYSKGKAYFIEINYRNGANSYGIIGKDVNFIYLWYLDALKKDTNQLRKKIGSPYYFMIDSRDFRHVIEKNIGILEWLRDIKKTEVFLLFNKKDKKPFIYQYIYYLGEKLCIY